MRKIFIKRKKCNMLPLFPLIHIQHSTFHRRASVPLSLQNGKRVAFFLLTSFSMFAFCKREHSASRLKSQFSSLKSVFSAQTANIVCGSLICLFSSSLACSILASVFSAPTAANTGSRLFYIHRRTSKASLPSQIANLLPLVFPFTEEKVTGYCQVEYGYGAVYPAGTTQKSVYGRADEGYSVDEAHNGCCGIAHIAKASGHERVIGNNHQ